MRPKEDLLVDERRTWRDVQERDATGRAIMLSRCTILYLIVVCVPVHDPELSKFGKLLLVAGHR